MRCLFAGCIRNGEEYILKSIENILEYSKLFDEYNILLVENGSTDNTKKILKKISNNKIQIFFKDELNSIKHRTIRLAKCRNFIINKILDEYNHYDFSIFVDLDNTGNYKIDLKSIESAIKFLKENINAAAIFANQKGIYYDKWALRHQDICPDDFWMEFYKEMGKNSIPGQILDPKIIESIFKKKIFNNHVRFPEEEKYISVNSAFGGFGIYKIKPITENKNKYNGYQNCNVILKDQTKIKKYYSKCEHVDFNLGLKNLGYDLYIKTNLINGEIKELYYPIKTVMNMVID